MTKGVYAGKASDLPPGEAREVEGPIPFALFNSGGKFFATQRYCSHEDAPLADGWVHDNGTIECPWHSACFDLSNGEPLCAPASRPIRTFPVHQVGDELYVEVDG
jgi:3-phenylpropionate/trans-cinnamate dioxygenase ferredoxin subunit